MNREYEEKDIIYLLTSTNNVVLSALRGLALFSSFLRAMLERAHTSKNIKTDKSVTNMTRSEKRFNGNEGRLEGY